MENSSPGDFLDPHLQSGMLNYLNKSQLSDIPNQGDTPLSYPYQHSAPTGNYANLFSGTPSAPTGNYANLFSGTSSVFGGVNWNNSQPPFMPMANDRNQCQGNLINGSNVSHPPNSGLNPQNVSATGTKVKAKESQPVVTIENACLGFIRSQLLRLDHHEVMLSTVLKFGLEEIKLARESLFRHTGTKSYSYQGLKDPSSPHKRGMHCVGSIIAKFEELNKSGQQINIVVSASDLYRLVIMFQNCGPAVESHGKMDPNLTEQLSKLQSDVKYLKSLPHNINPAAMPTPRYSSSAVKNRKELIRSVNVNTPNKRRRIEESVSDNSVSTTPAKEGATNVPPPSPWNTASYKRNGRRPGSQPPLRGKPPPAQSTDHEVFLFRYNEQATKEDVLTYFKNEGVSAYHIRYRCHESSETKCFVMKIRNRSDYVKVIMSLPEYTGCRWYVAGPPPQPEDKPASYFNTGKRISGPDMDRIIQHHRESLHAGMDTDNAHQPDTSSVREFPPMSQPSDIAPPTPQPAVTTNSPLATAVSASPVTVTASHGTSGITTVTSTKVTTSVAGITALNSPHLNTNNVKYDTVIHNE